MLFSDLKLEKNTLSAFYVYSLFHRTDKMRRYVAGIFSKTDLERKSLSFIKNITYILYIKS